MFNINSRNVSEAERALVLAYSNLISFGKLFLSGDFNKNKTPIVHYEIARELDSDSNKPIAIIMMRGAAKTTLVKASIIKDFCFAKKAYEWGLADKERHLFFGWVSSSQRKSRNNVAYVRLHLEKNEKIAYYFGDPKLKIYNLRGDTWNQEEIITAYGDKLISSSNLTSMRGDTQPTITKGNLRYSRVFCDDSENEDNTKTVNGRATIVDNIMNGILPAIEKTEPGCRLFFIGTPVHYASMAQKFIDTEMKLKKQGQKAIDEYPWKIMVYGATQPTMEGGVLWHDRLPRHVLNRIKEEYKESPKGVSGYYQEYELQVQSSELSLLGKKSLKHWKGYFEHDPVTGLNYVVVKGENGTPRKVLVNTFLGCDPATDIATKNSDYSVIMVIAVDMMNNTLVLDYVRRLSIPTIGLRDRNGNLVGNKGVVDYIFDMYEKYHCKSGTVEDVAMTRSVFQSLQSEYMRRQKYLSIIPESPGGKEKINKIYSGLSPLFAAGSIFLLEGHYELEHEIVIFGDKMDHDDCVESLFFARKNAYPPMLKYDKKSGNYIKPVRKAKSWKVA